MDRTTCGVDDDDVPVGARGGGSLSTARCALQTLALLERRPEGVRAEEVAEAVGKSISTAYYLLRALCEEGFAVHGPHRGVYRAVVHGVDDANRPEAGGPDAQRRELSLAALADELFAHTHKRSYIGVLRRGAIEIVEVRGRQGLPRQPGLGDRISDAAHATAMGKVVLGLMRPVAVQRYIDRGLRQFAADTIRDPERLLAELEAGRRDGFCTEVEELTADFCCVAAPVFDGDGGLRAVAGVSMSRRAFEESSDVLARAVKQVASTKLVVPRRASVGPPPPSMLEKSGVS